MFKGASRFLQHRSLNAKKPTHINVFSNKKKKSRHSIPNKLKQAFKSQGLVKGWICDKVKGGYTIAIDSYRAFCPYSEKTSRPLSQSVLNNLQGQKDNYVIIKIELNSVIVSRKKAIQLQTWKKIYNVLSDGTTISGIVKEIKPYGAFIDFGGVDGSLHISKINNAWISDINSFLKKGQLIKVFVLNVDETKKKISLSLQHPQVDYVR